MPARQTAAHQTESPSYKVGYRNPPRHAQFRKGQSGNPGGRPRRDEAERLKAITLQEAYRGVAIKENGVMVPVAAIQAVMRRQVELAMEGNVHAQRDLLRAVRTYERADAEKAAMEEYVEELARQGADLLEEGVLAARRAAQTPEKKLTLIEAAQRVRELLGLHQRKDNDEAGDPGTTETDAEQQTAEEPEEQDQEDVEEEAETATEETDTEWNAAPPQPENGRAPAIPPFVSQPAAERPADLRPRQARRRASRGTPEPAPSEGADAGARSYGITRGVIPRESGGSSNPRRCGVLDPRFREDDSGEAHAPAAKSAKVPDKFPVLRDSGRRSKRAARRQRGRGG
jgi:hypothetical protein